MQEYWGGLPFPPPRDLPNPGIKPTSPVYPALQVDSLPTEPLWKPLASPPFPNWQLLKSAHWNSGKVIEAGQRLFPVVKETWAQKSFVLRSPTGSCLVSVNYLHMNAHLRRRWPKALAQEDIITNFKTQGRYNLFKIASLVRVTAHILAQVWLLFKVMFWRLIINWGHSNSGITWWIMLLYHDSDNAHPTPTAFNSRATLLSDV